MPNNHFSILLLTIILLCATPAQAAIYKWVDGNGMVHYSDIAPETRPSQILVFGHIGKPAESKQRGRANHQPITIQRAQPSSFNTTQIQQKQFRAFQLIDKNKHGSPVDDDAPIDLNAKEYDIQQMRSKRIKRKAMKNIKEKLCNENRMLLAALQEAGFNSYYDEQGHYRLAWGGDGIYQGKRRFLSDKEVSKKTTKVIFEVEQYCDRPDDQTLQQTARANWIRAEYCMVSKAVLEDLKHPFMRSTNSKIDQQTDVVKRLCTQLKPGQHRDDERYYPKVLRTRVVLPRHLTLEEEETPEANKITANRPQEILTQLLTLIE